MLPCFSSDPPSRATALHLVARDGFDGWRQRHPQHDGWLAHCAWRADPGSFTFLPAANDAPPSVLASAADGVEGRLVLCDALSEACAEQPALVIDAATLTGSAKATLGSEVQALFCDDDALATSLVRESFEVGDPVWRLPLWRPYRKRLDSPIADFGNVAKGLFADAIVAALYLQEFVPRSQPWMHLDVMGTNPLSRPGRPEGGEATGLLALYRLLRRRWAAPGAPS